jgi:trk/ktr system potassium uptake protein
VPFFRPILLINGLLLTTLGFAMLIPALVDPLVDHPASGQVTGVFLTASGVTTFAGVSLSMANWGFRGDITIRQAFALTTLSWIGAVSFAALPFAFSGLGMSFTDAFFESMSGLTTTGSTVIVGLDDVPPGLLLWRALLQWLGGIGIIVMAIAILPLLQVGGMQLFRLESSDTSQKILPRATQIAGSITLLYVALSFICAIAYSLAGMSTFDAAAHAMTTIATGGYSTSDGSLGSFNSVSIEIICIIFMLVGSLPFVLYLQALRGRAKPLLLDSQVQWFLGTLVAVILLMTLYQFQSEKAVPFGTALRTSSFNVVSILTGTGYATEDYMAWGPFAAIAFFCIMFIGGCAGSTTCGIKVFRFQVIFAALKVQIRRMIHPHGVFFPQYNGQKIPPSVVSSVSSYFFLFFVSFSVLAVCLSLLGLDTITAFSAAGTAIANVGPGLGDTVGPASTFAGLPDSAKWLMSAGMLLGRLELFTVLVMFTPGFWKM